MRQIIRAVVSLDENSNVNIAEVNSGEEILKLESDLIARLGWFRDDETYMDADDPWVADCDALGHLLQHELGRNGYAIHSPALFINAIKFCMLPGPVTDPENYVFVLYAPQTVWRIRVGDSMMDEHEFTDVAQIQDLLNAMRVGHVAHIHRLR